MEDKDKKITENLPFFDDSPGLSPMERADVEQAAENVKAEKLKTKNRSQQRRKRRMHRNRKGEKIQGVWILPVYQQTYNCMKECMFRFRRLPKEERASVEAALNAVPRGSSFLKGEIGRDAISMLRRSLVQISMVYWQVKPKSILPDVFEVMLEAVVTIRALRDMGLLSVHDYGCICRYSGPMIQHMKDWSKHYNKVNPELQDVAEKVENSSSPSQDGAANSLVKEDNLK